MARPSEYTPEVGEFICLKMAEGKSLTEIRELDNRVPSRVTIIKWKVTYPEFAALYKEARAAQAEHYVDEILKETERPSTDKVDAMDKRTKIDTLKWIACKFYPRVYGERVAQEISGPNGGPITLAAVDAPPQETREQWLERKSKEAKDRLNGTATGDLVPAVRTANGAA